MFDPGKREEPAIALDLIDGAIARREINEGIEVAPSNRAEEIDHSARFQNETEIRYWIRQKLVEDSCALQKIGREHVTFAGMAIAQQREMCVRKMPAHGPDRRQGNNGVAKLTNAKDQDSLGSFAKR